MIGYPDLLAALVQFGLITQQQADDYQQQMNEEWADYLERREAFMTQKKAEYGMRPWWKKIPPPPWQEWQVEWHEYNNDA